MFKIQAENIFFLKKKVNKKYKIRKVEREVDKINTLEKLKIRTIKGCSSTKERGRRVNY